jgi:mercuric ion transport protein
MNDPALISTGAVGSVVAAICCATPIVAVVLGTFGLAAWLSIADYVLIPALPLFLSLLALGLYRRRAAAQACCDPASSNQGTKR